MERQEQIQIHSFLKIEDASNTDFALVSTIIVVCFGMISGLYIHHFGFLPHAMPQNNGALISIRLCVISRIGNIPGKGARATTRKKSIEILPKCVIWQN